MSLATTPQVRLVVVIVTILTLKSNSLRAQHLLQLGDAVATCQSQDPDDPVIGVINTELASTQPLNKNWLAPMYHGPVSSPWTLRNLGLLFGIAIDEDGNIYTAAGRCYNNAPAFQNGPGGSGGIYKLVQPAGAIEVLCTTLNRASGTVVGTSTIPNMNAGIGNLCWDRTFKQLFVTNLEDGKIYRIKEIAGKGIIQSVFDPIAPDNGSPGTVQLGEFVWGIGTYRQKGVTRVYYAVWVNGFDKPNVIRSIALDATGEFIPTTDRLEVTVPLTTEAVDPYYAAPSDIEFSTDGKMLLAERTMTSLTSPYAHSSRVLEIIPSGTGWVVQPDLKYSMGSYAVGENSAGGCDFGYSGYDATRKIPSGCEQEVWATGDALHFPDGPNYYPGYIYGLARMSEAGADILSEVFIDLNGDTLSQNKSQIGDVDIYRIDCPSDPEIAALPSICLLKCATLHETSGTKYASYHWTCNGGSITSPDGADSVTVCFNDTGTFAVNVATTDMLGGNSSATTIVQVKSPKILNITASSVAQTAIGETVAIPLVLSDAIVLSSFTCDLAFDAAHLGYLGTYNSSKIRVDLPGSFPAGTSSILLNGADLTTDTVCVARFRVFSNMDTRTSVQFKNVTPTLSGSDQCAGVSGDGIEAEIDLMSNCANGTISDFLRYDSVPKLTLISHADGSHALHSTQLLTDPSLEVIDELGRAISRVEPAAVRQNDGYNYTIPDVLHSGPMMLVVRDGRSIRMLRFVQLN